MSNEENTEQQAVEASTEETSSAEKDTSSVEETSAKPKESVSVDVEPVETSQNFVATVMQLKDSNPKVFFGAIGGVVLLFLIVVMSGGDSAPVVKGQEMKTLVKGNKYILKSANGQDPGATVRLVASPDNIAAYDDTEEADRNTPCQHIAQGTPVTVTELQDMYGTKNAFSKVLIEEGSCKGKDGWVLSIDVQ